MMEAHAARALDERLDDEGGDLVVARGEDGAQRVGGFDRALDAAEALVVGVARGKGGHQALAQERRVCVAKDRHVGHAQRAHGLAVVAALQREEARFFRPAAIGPRVERHLERDLGRRGAVGSEEGVPERSGCEPGEPFGELDGAGMGEPGEHHVLEGVELFAQRRVDRRVRVAEEVDPPRAHRIEIAATVEVVQPGSLAARDGHQREALVGLHLRAGMPHRREAPRDHLAIGHRGRQSGTMRLICAARALVASVARGAIPSRGNAIVPPVT